MINDIKQSIVGSMHPLLSTLKTSDYHITDNDYMIGIGTLSSDIVIKLPLAPSISDQYIIKDVAGTSDGYKITIDGYGHNIDGNISFILSQSYASVTLVYTGLQWSVSFYYAGKQNGNGYGTYSMLPKQGQFGRTYYATDTGSLYYDDGIEWRAFGHDGSLTPVKQSDFMWQNQNGATATDFGNGIFITVPNNSGLRFLYQNVPTTPYTLTAKFIYVGSFIPNSVMIYGLALGDGTKIITAHVNDNGDAMNFNVGCWDNPTIFNSELFTYNFRDVADRLEWFRISDDGTNRTVSVSRDGINFINIYIGSNSTFLTATQIGLVVALATNNSGYVSCVSFKLES